MKAGEAQSGKTERDENFPVASRLIAPQFRAVILAFYRFARKADDVADHPSLPPQAKLDALDALEASLTGARNSEPEAVALRAALASRNLSQAHARDLIGAFRLDVTKGRYRDWSDLMDYCALSAMPVGRFVLDVHGESASLWPASDAICASLQVINHLQDCAEDFARLDRIYLPEDALQRAGASYDDLAAPRASPRLRAAIVDLAQKTGALLDRGADLGGRVNDWRLACEIGAIVRLARANVGRLMKCDPLSERVHPGKGAFLWTSLVGAAEGAIARARGEGRPAAVGARGK
ncbi:squalene synthase HpnC [Methylocapsa sp. S129]|uniref:squalene synthase HpnC n=1 Tax=Methylocapsa sp. S129 TaxID=1641869 RepID=UPI00131A7DA0|nr:squalene synthase HpnC [Methylocapsa sp. S129]